MTHELKLFILDLRLYLMYLRKGLLKCHDLKCRRGALIIGDLVVSRMMSRGYGSKFRCKTENQRTQRVLYHYDCARELNLV